MEFLVNLPPQETSDQDKRPQVFSETGVCNHKFFVRRIPGVTLLNRFGWNLHGMLSWSGRRADELLSCFRNGKHWLCNFRVTMQNTVRSIVGSMYCHNNNRSQMIRKWWFEKKKKYCAVVRHAEKLDTTKNYPNCCVNQRLSFMSNNNYLNSPKA